MFSIYFLDISFTSWIALTLLIFTLLGSISAVLLLYMLKRYGGFSDLLYYPLLPLMGVVCLVPGVISFTGAIFGKQRTFYRVQRFSKNIPTTETSVKLVEASLAVFSLIAIAIFLNNPSAIYFYATYLVVMIASFTNFSVSPRKMLFEI